MAQAKVEAKRGPGRPPGNGVGALVRRKLLEGENDSDAIIAAVRAAFPRSKMRRRGVSWYRSMLRRQGHYIPEAEGPTTVA